MLPLVRRWQGSPSKESEKKVSRSTISTFKLFELVYSPRTAEVIGIIQTQNGELVFIPESITLSESTVRYVVDRMAELKDRR